MEELIKQAFLQVDVLGPHVQNGHYDLIAPSGEVVLPSTWELLVKPDWAVTMTMWPIEKSPPIMGPRRYGAPPGMLPPLAGGRRVGGMPPPPPPGWNGRPLPVDIISLSSSSSGSSTESSKGRLSKVTGVFKRGGLLRSKQSKRK